MRILKIFLQILVVFMPWKIRRVVLNRFWGYDIRPGAKIGFSYIPKTSCNGRRCNDRTSKRGNPFGADLYGKRLYYLSKKLDYGLPFE